MRWMFVRKDSSIIYDAKGGDADSNLSRGDSRGNFTRASTCCSKAKFIPLGLSTLNSPCDMHHNINQVSNSSLPCSRFDLSCSQIIVDADHILAQSLVAATLSLGSQLVCTAYALVLAHSIAAVVLVVPNLQPVVASQLVAAGSNLSQCYTVQRAFGWED